MCILGFDLNITLKRKNSDSNVISEPKLVTNEVLHWILGILCQKFIFQDGHWFWFWRLDDL